MAKVSGVPRFDREDPGRDSGWQAHTRCKKCSASVYEDEILISGRGTWKDKLMCKKCGHFWVVSFENVIIPMVAALRGISEEEVRERQRRL